MRRLNRRIIITILVMITSFLLFGCGKKYKMNDSYIFPGTNGIPVATTPSEEIENEHSPDIEEHNQDSNQIEAENVDDRFVLKVENKNVYINGTRLDYAQDDTNDLIIKLSEKLSDVSRDKTVFINYNFGDDAVCTQIDEVLARLGVQVEIIVNEAQ